MPEITREMIAEANALLAPHELAIDEEEWVGEEVCIVDGPGFEAEIEAFYDGGVLMWHAALPGLEFPSFIDAVRATIEASEP